MTCVLEKIQRHAEQRGDGESADEFAPKKCPGELSTELSWKRRTDVALGGLWFVEAFALQHRQWMQVCIMTSSPLRLKHLEIGMRMVPISHEDWTSFLRHGNLDPSRANPSPIALWTTADLTFSSRGVLMSSDEFCGWSFALLSFHQFPLRRVSHTFFVYETVAFSWSRVESCSQRTGTPPPFRRSCD